MSIETEKSNASEQLSVEPMTPAEQLERFHEAVGSEAYGDPLLGKSKAATGDGLTQSERFMQAARELECDDDPDRFAERVRKLVKMPAKDQVPGPGSNPSSKSQV